MGAAEGAVVVRAEVVWDRDEGVDAGGKGWVDIRAGG